MKIKDITNYLNSIAPLQIQESYDNAGLIVGNMNQEVTGVLVCLDSIEEIIDEAMSKGCNLIVAHHPIVFSGLKKFTGKNYIERCIIKAIKNDIAIYACHTNLDNMQDGVNKMISDRLGLVNTKILVPKGDQVYKLSVFCPKNAADQVRDAMFSQGAGHVGQYSECSYNSEGIGTFLGNEGTNPHVGEIGKRHHEPETKIEVIVSSWKKNNVINAMLNAHPYEEVAYDIHALENKMNTIGAGLIGELKEEMDTSTFLNSLKKNMKTNCVRHTKVHKQKILKVALCGGSGSFLLGAAMSSKADIFITGDFKYHQFFDADGKIIIADIGHFESEQFTIELLGEKLKEKFPNFAVHFTDVNTNPINYL